MHPAKKPATLARRLGLLGIPVLLASVLTAIITTGQEPRESWQPPEEIMDAIGVRPGMVIGEAGAGRGYFTFYLAERVGPEGKIYANDISQGSLDALQARAERERVENIEIVMGEVVDPLFPEKDLDMIVMVYVLHMLERPLEFLNNVKKYMAPEASLVIIEQNTDHDRGHPPSFMSKKQILDAIQKAGYVLQRKETFLPRDTIYVLGIEDGA